MNVKTRLEKLAARSRGKRIPVVRLDGHIGDVGFGRSGLSGDGMEKVLHRAFTGDRVQAVVLVINSPGGSPAQSEYIAERIRQLASENGVKVFAFCEDLAASGGYWIACAADEVFVAKTSMVGSIGVVSSGFGAPNLLSRIGLERRVYTAGEAKSRLDMFSPEKPEDVQWLTGMQTDLHQTFIDWVQQRRGSALNPDAALFTGDVWIGKKAVDVGLADAVGTYRSVMAERYPDADIELIETPKPLLARLAGGGVQLAGVADDVVTGTFGAIERRARSVTIAR